MDPLVPQANAPHPCACRSSALLQGDPLLTENALNGPNLFCLKAVKGVYPMPTCRLSQDGHI